MRIHDRDIRDVDALIISHDHDDHIRSAGIFQRLFGLPLYLTERTRRATRCNLGRLHDVHYFRAGEPLHLSGVIVHTIPTPHDAADGVAFVVEHAGRRLGVLTDLGHPFAALRDCLPTLDAAYIESNYDPDMLERGSYPPYLKRRIRGGNGHLSNPQSADLVRAAGTKWQWVALAHLSQENNTPELALDTHRRAVGRELPFVLASRYHVSEMLEL